MTQRLTAEQVRATVARLKAMAALPPAQQPRFPGAVGSLSGPIAGLSGDPRALWVGLLTDAQNLANTVYSLARALREAKKEPPCP